MGQIRIGSIIWPQLGLTEEEGSELPQWLRRDMHAAGDTQEKTAFGDLSANHLERRPHSLDPESQLG